MKNIKYISLLLFLFTSVCFAQTPAPKGTWFNGATKSDTLSRKTRVPILNDINILNSYVPVDSLSSHLDLDKIPETTNSKILTAAERELIGTALQTETDPVFTAWDKDYNDLINKPTIPTPLIEEIYNPIDEYFGRRIKPILESEGFFIESTENKASGYLVKNSGSGNGVYAGLSTSVGSSPFTNGSFFGTYGLGYEYSWLRGNTAAYANNTLYLISDNKDKEIVMAIKKDTLSNGLIESSYNKVLQAKSSGLLLAPTLSQDIITADVTGKVLTTKEWVLANAGGGGDVDSVNGQTGVVVLDADDIDDTITAHKFVTSTEKGLISTALQPSAISNTAYNASSWDGVTTIAPSKDAVRDKFETMVTLNTAQTITAQKTFSRVTLANTGIIDFSGNHNSLANGTVPLISRKADKLAFYMTAGGGVNSRLALFDGSLIVDSDKTFTFPNKSGTIALLDDISGGGAVSSVQGYTGAVVIDPDDLNDTSTTNKFVTSTEKGLIGTALQPSNNLAELTNFATARSNLGLVIGTNVLAPNGSAANLTNFPTFNQNTTGSAASLTTARNFTIGGTAKSFNGSANVTWSTSEIGITKSNIDALNINAASIGGISVTGVPTSGQVLKATSSTAATWDDESGGESVNTAFRIVSSTSGDFIEEFNAEQPNFQLHLDEDVTIEITDAVNGDFLIANIVNDDVSEDTFKVTLVGTVNLEFELKHGESTLVTMVTDADDNISWVRSYPKGYKPTSVHDTATIYMDGDSVYDDTTADASTITLNDCDAGETLKVYINRASAPTLAGTGLSFNQLPNTTAFEAATDMVITFIVTPLLNSGDKVIDYYYTER